MTTHSYAPNSGYVKTTFLLNSIEMQSMEIIKFLVRHDANVNELARFGIRRTPLQKAVELNNLQIFAAIKGNNYEMAMMLIRRGAQLDVPQPLGRRGRWPLEGAAENGRLDMIQLLW
ncbi:hypothetical protein F5X99DRAFT_432368 [Biscogniauxia marginata]|nr:hypothetical protein F5X99DRAFT_432368 [Biscogniauxia marginata]